MISPIVQITNLMYYKKEHLILQTANSWYQHIKHEQTPSNCYDCVFCHVIIVISNMFKQHLVDMKALKHE